MNKPITTRVNQSSSMGMKVREPMLDVGSVAKQAKEDDNKIEQAEGYVLGQDGSVGYGSSETVNKPGSDPVMGYSGNKIKLTKEQADWRNKEIERLGGVQQYRDHYKIGKKNVVLQEGTKGESKKMANIGDLKVKQEGNYVAPWTLRQDIRGDKIAKNKAQRQKLKTMRQSGEFGESKVSQFKDALKKKKSANESSRADKQQARKDKRKAMKELRGQKKDMTDAAFQAKKKAIKDEKANTLEKSQNVIDANKKQFKKDVGNIKGRDKEKIKAVKQEYNKKLSDALDAKLDVRVKGSQQGASHSNKDQKVDLGGRNLKMDDLTIDQQKSVIKDSEKKEVKSPNTKLKSPYKMYTKSPFKLAAKSPLAKALVGNQHKLPQHLQDAIKAAPGKNYKKGYYGK